jgi:hypothetical protein
MLDVVNIIRMVRVVQWVSLLCPYLAAYRLFGWELKLADNGVDFLEALMKV